MVEGSDVLCNTKCFLIALVDVAAMVLKEYGLAIEMHVLIQVQNL